MELNELSNRGKLINVLIVLANAITFIAYFAGRHAYFLADPDAFQKVVTAQNIVRVIAGAVGVGGLIYTIILMNNNPEKKIKGFGTLLAACITTIVFAVIGIMFGIVIWILSGISIRQLESSFREASTIDSWEHYSQKVGGRAYNNQDMYGNGQYGSPYNNQDMYGNGQYGGPNNNQNMYGNGQYCGPYNNQDMYGNGQYGGPYNNQNMNGNQQYGNPYGNQGAYGSQNAYGNQQMQQNTPPQNIQEPKVASHPNGFGVQEEPDIDFSDL